MAFQYVDYPQEMKDLLMQIFDDSFMQANTRFQSFEGFRYSSAVFVNWNSDCLISVSYTHLTLPTICSV